MSASKLLDLALQQTYNVSNTVLPLLQNAVKTAGLDIAPVFFGTSSKPFVQAGVDDTGELNSFAQAYVSWQVSFQSHGFDKVMNRDTAYNAWLNWIRTKGKTVGKNIFFQSLIDNANFQEFVTNRDTLMKEISATWTTKPFVITQGLRLLGGGNTQPLQMLLLFVQDLDNGAGQPVFSAVQAAMKKYLPPQFQGVADNYEVDFFDDFISGHVFMGSNQQGIYSQVAKATNLQTGSTGGGDTSYNGAAVATWLHNAGPYWNHNAPANSTYHKKSGGGCFLPGTSVIFVDESVGRASAKAIELIQENELVVGANGGLTAISSEYHVAVIPKPSLVYGFNGEEPFFFSDHMFWTTTGWRCIDPSQALDDNPHVRVGKLRVGDRVLRLRDTGLPLTYDRQRGRVAGVAYDEVEIKCISTRCVDAGTVMYDLHSREGLRSYHANRYLVTLNYPELTPARIARSIRRNLTPDEEQQLLQGLGPIEEDLGSVLGPGCLPAIKELLDENHNLGAPTGPSGDTSPVTTSRSPVTTSRHDLLHDHHVPLLHLHREASVDECLSTAEGLRCASDKPSYALPVVSLVFGHVFVNHERADASVVRGDCVFWRRALDDGSGRVEHGAVRMAGHGLTGSGVVGLTHGDHDGGLEAVQSRIKFRLAVPSTTFNTNLRYTPHGHPDHEVTVGLVLASHSIEKDIAVARIVDRVSGAELGFVSDVSFAHDDGQCHLHVQFTEPGTMCPYEDAHLVISKNCADVRGHATHHETKEAVPVHGTTSSVATSAHATTHAGQLRAASEAVNNQGKLLRSPLTSALLQPSDTIPDPASPPETVKAMPASKTASLTTSVPLTTAVALLGDHPLTVAMLLNISAPANATLNSDAQDRIQLYSKYLMSDHERSLIGANKPSLDPSEKAFLTDPGVVKFFTDEFNPGFLAQGFSSFSQFDHDWVTSPPRDDKLNFFWAGNGKGTLSSNAAYSKVQQQAAQYVFRNGQAKTAFDPFFSDPTTTPQEWAAKLYAQVTSPLGLNSLINAWNSNGDNAATMLNKVCMMLFCLDPGKTYSENLYQAVAYGAVLAKVEDASFEDKQKAEAFMQGAMQALIVRIINYDGKGKDPNTDVFAGLQKTLSEALHDAGVDQSKTAVQQAVAFQQATLAYGNNLLTAFRSRAGRIASKVAGGDNGAEKPEKWAKTKAVGDILTSVMALATVGYGMYQSIQTISNWKTLSTEQQVMAVVNLVVQSYQLVSSTIYLLKAFANPKLPFAKKMTFLQRFSSSVTDADTNTNYKDNMNEMSKDDGEDLGEGSGLAKVALTSSETTELLPKTKWYSKWKTKMGQNKMQAVGEVINILFMTASTVVLGLQVARDFETDQPAVVKTLDIINTVVSALAVTVSVAQFITVSDRAAVALPIVGAVISLIGLVLSIVSGAIHKNPPPPKTPQEKWIIATGSTFVTDLPDPSPAWSISRFSFKDNGNQVLPGKAKTVPGETAQLFVQNLLGLDDADAPGMTITGAFEPTDAATSELHHINSSGRTVAMLGNSTTTPASDDAGKTLLFVTNAKLTSAQAGSGAGDNVDMMAWNSNKWGVITAATSQYGYFFYGMHWALAKGAYHVTLESSKDFSVYCFEGAGAISLSTSVAPPSDDSKKTSAMLALDTASEMVGPVPHDRDLSLTHFGQAASETPLIKVSLRRGKVVVDGQLATAGSANRGLVLWRREHPDGGPTELGHLRLAANGLGGSGVVQLRHGDGAVMSNTAVSVKTETVKYSLLVETKQQADQGKPPSPLKGQFNGTIATPPVWEDDTLFLEIGHTVKADGTPGSTFGRLYGADSLSVVSDESRTVVTTDDQGNTTFKLYPLGSEYTKYDFSGVIGTADILGNVTGSVTLTKEGATPLVLSGKFVAVVPGSQDNTPPATPALLGLSAWDVEPLAQYGRHQSRAGLADANALAHHAPLTVQRLANMSLPSTEAINQDVQQRMLLYSKFTMSDEERALLGATKPSLSPEETAELEDPVIRRFFEQSFNPGFLASGFSPYPDLATAWGATSETERQTGLDFFWSGRSRGCLAADPAYGRVQRFTARWVLGMAAPGLQEYINDDPAKWAAELFDQMAELGNLNTFISTFADGNVEYLNRMCSLLYALDPASGYDGKLYRLVAFSTAMRTTSTVQFGNDPDTTTSIMTNAFEQFLLKIAAYRGDDPTADPLFAELKEQFDEACDEAEVEKSPDVGKMVAEFVLKTAKFKLSLVGAFVKYRRAATIAERTATLSKDEKLIPARWRSGSEAVIEVVQKVVSLSALVYGLYQNIDTLTKWNDLTLDKQVASVISVIAKTASLIDLAVSVVDVAKAFRNGDGFKTRIESIQRVSTRMSDRSSSEDLESIIRSRSSSDSSVLPVVNKSLETPFQKYKKQWIAKMGVTARVAEMLNIVFYVASTVSMSIQLARDWDTNPDDAFRALSVINVVVSSLGISLSMANLFVVSGGAAIILPVVSSGLALLGLVLSTIITAIKKPPKRQKTPQERWVENRGRAFIAAIPKPTAEWAVRQLRLSMQPRYLASPTLTIWTADLLGVSNVDSPMVTGADGARYEYSEADGIGQVMSGESHSVTASVTVTAKVPADANETTQRVYFSATQRLCLAKIGNEAMTALLQDGTWSSNLLHAAPHAGYYFYKGDQGQHGGVETTVVQVASATAFSIQAFVSPVLEAQPVGMASPPAPTPTLLSLSSVSCGLTDGKSATMVQAPTTPDDTSAAAPGSSQASKSLPNTDGYMGHSFVAGTSIVTVDSNRSEVKEVPVEEVQEGTHVVAANGVVSYASDQSGGSKLRSPCRLYGINGSKPFFHPSHLFWTETGWRSIDPVQARKFNPHVRVGRLRVGDHVLKAKPLGVAARYSATDGTVVGPAYTLQRITEFTSEMVPAGTRLFSVHIREGPQSYHANGFLVNHNFPELTTSTLTQRIRSAVPLNRRKLFCETMADLEPLIARVLNPMVVPAVRLSLAQQASASGANAVGDPLKDRARHPDDLLHDHDVPELRLTGDPHRGVSSRIEQQYSGFLPVVSLKKGHVFVDTKPVEHSKVEGNRVLWRRQLPHGVEHGALSLLPHGLAGVGSITVTTSSDEHDSPTVRSSDDIHHVTVQIPSTEYDVVIDGQPRDLTLVLDHELDHAGHPSVLRCQVLDGAGVLPAGRAYCFSKDETDERETHISLAFSGAGHLQPFHDGELTLDGDASKLTGRVWQYDNQASGNRGREVKMLAVRRTQPTATLGHFVASVHQSDSVHHDGTPIVLAASPDDPTPFVSTGGGGKAGFLLLSRKFHLSLGKLSKDLGPLISALANSFSLTLENGKVKINGKAVASATYSGTTLNVSYQALGYVFSISLEMHAPYLQIHGRFSIAKQGVPATELSSAPVTASSTVTYMTTIAGSGATTWNNSKVALEVGYDASGKLVQNVLSEGKALQGAQLHVVTLQTGQVTLNLSMLPSLGSLVGFIEGGGTVDDTGAGFSGSIHAYDKSAPGFVGPATTWSGSSIDEAAAPLQTLMAPTPLLMNAVSPRAALAVPVDGAASGPLPPVRSSPPPSLARATAMLSTDAGLSIAMLKTLPPPNSDVVHEQTQNKLTQYTYYSMSDDQLKLLGADRPKLTQREIDYISQPKLKEFLSTDFARGMISQGLLGATSLNKDWSNADQAKEKLKYFWKGSLTGCLAGYPAYSTVQNFAGNQAFVELMGQDLEQYLAKSPKVWAKQLYESFTKQDVTFQTVVNQYLMGNRVQLNKYCMILYALDPTENYSTNLWKEVVWGAAAPKVSQITAEDQAILDEFLPQAFNELVLRILNNSAKDPSGKDSVYTQLQTQLREAMEKMGMDMSNSAADLAAEFGTQMKAYPVALITAFQQIPKGTFSQRIANSLDNKALQNPKLAAGGEVAGNIMALAGLGFSLYQMYGTIMNWDKLTVEQKVLGVTNAILGTVQGIVGISKTVMSVIKLVKVFRSPDSSLNDKIGADSEFSESLESPETAQSLGDVADEVAPELAPELDVAENPGIVRIGQAASEAEAIEGGLTAASRMETIMNVVSKVGEALNVLMLAAATVSLGFQVKADFDNGAPLAIKIIDIANTVVTGIATLVAFGAMFIAEILPVLGVVLALVGVVLAIVSYILHKHEPPPETPQDKWIKGTGQAFVDAIPKASADFSLGEVSDLKPVPLVIGGGAEAAFNNDLTKALRYSGTVDGATFSALSDTHLAQWSGTELSLTVDNGKPVDQAGPAGPAPAAHKKNIFFASTSKLSNASGSSKMVSLDKTAAWKEDLNAVEQHGGFYFYKVEFTPAGSGTWAVHISASSTFTVNIFVQDAGIIAKPLIIKKPGGSVDAA